MMEKKVGCLFMLLLFPLSAILHRDEDTGEFDIFFGLTFCLVYFIYFIFVLLIEDLSVFLVSSVIISCILYSAMGTTFLYFSALAILIILFIAYKLSCEHRKFMLKKQHTVEKKQSFWTSLSHGYQLLHTEIANEVKKVL